MPKVILKTNFIRAPFLKHHGCDETGDVENRSITSGLTETLLSE